MIKRICGIDVSIAIFVIFICFFIWAINKGVQNRVHRCETAKAIAQQTLANNQLELVRFQNCYQYGCYFTAKDPSDRIIIVRIRYDGAIDFP